MVTRDFNYTEYNKLKDGEHFWMLDVNNAFWQMMYLLSIIPKDIYDNYKMNKEYRLLKQVAIGLVNAPKSATFIVDGKLLRDPFDDRVAYSVKEANMQWQTVYENVRHSCYNIPIDICNMLNGEYISYNQDAIFVRDCNLPTVQDYMNKHKIEYKKMLCKRIDKTHYYVGTKIRAITEFAMRDFN